MAWGLVDLDLKRIGAKIRHLRTEQKLSQDELAYRADLKRTNVGGVERGERNLGVLNLIAIARALDVAPATLLSDVPGVPSIRRGRGRNAVIATAGNRNRRGAP